MATIINTPGQDNGSSAAGWAVAVIILIVVILIGLFVWPGYARRSAAPAPAQPGATVQVNLPGGDTGAPAAGATPSAPSGAAPAPAQ